MTRRLVQEKENATILALPGAQKVFCAGVVSVVTVVAMLHNKSVPESATETKLLLAVMRCIVGEQLE